MGEQQRPRELVRGIAGGSASRPDRTTADDEDDPWPSPTSATPSPARPPGRDARKPSDIPGTGWKAIGKRVVASLKLDHVSLLAAGVAFKALLALFPAIVAAISIWGLVADPSEITQQLEASTAALPSGAGDLLNDQMDAGREPASRRPSGSRCSCRCSSRCGARRAGPPGLVEGINAAYDEVDRRTFPDQARARAAADARRHRRASWSRSG